MVCAHWSQTTMGSTVVAHPVRASASSVEAGVRGMGAPSGMEPRCIRTQTDKRFAVFHHQFTLYYYKTIPKRVKRTSSKEQLELIGV